MPRLKRGAGAWSCGNLIGHALLMVKGIRRGWEGRRRRGEEGRRGGGEAVVEK